MKIRAERGNVVLYIEEHEAQHYQSLGYVVTLPGDVAMPEEIPTNVGELRIAYVESKKRILELERTVERLKADIETLQKKKLAKK